MSKGGEYCLQFFDPKGFSFLVQMKLNSILVDYFMKGNITTKVQKFKQIYSVTTFHLRPSVFDMVFQNVQ